MKTLLIALAALIVNSAAIAASPVGSNDYNSREVRQVSTVKQGTIVDMRSVQIHDTMQTSGFSSYGNNGTAVGGLVGGVLGNALGGGNFALSTVGAAAGAMIGNSIYQEQSADARMQEGIEALVELDDGTVISITQGNEGVNFMKGDRVNIIQGASGTRIWKSNRTVSQAK